MSTVKKNSEMSEEKVNHLLAPPHTSPYPWLVSWNDKSQIFCSITEKTSSTHSIPGLAGKKFENSCHGWLILSTMKEKLSLWNPITFESINLPPLNGRNFTGKFDETFCVCLLSPPSDPDSTVIMYDKVDKSLWFFRRRRWFKHSQNNYFFSSPVSCSNNKKIYAITVGYMKEGILGEFELNKRKRRVELKVLGELPLPRRKNSRYLRKDLVESCGDLFVIYTDFGVRNDRIQVVDIEIHKFELVGTMGWERVTSIPNRAFFLDNCPDCFRCGSFSVTCSKEFGNRIFIFASKECTLSSYHIEDRSVLASLPCTDHQTLQGFFVKWLMPDWSNEIHGEAVKKNIGKEGNKSSGKGAEGSEIVEKESNGTKLVDLPIEILKCITDRVPTIDYLNLRHASKVCRQATPSLKFETAISRSENLSNSLSPWLVSLRKDGRLCTLSHPHSLDHYNVHVPEELQDDASMLWHCKDGWLLVSKSRGDIHDLSFFNPFTKRVERYKKLVELPRVLFQIAFSAPPTSPNCVVVAFQALFSGAILISIGRSKKEDWKQFYYTLDQSHHFLPTHDNPIFSNGAFYFLGRDAKVGVVKFLEEEGCAWQVIHAPQGVDPLVNESFLAERDGDIFLVLVYGRRNVRIFSLDFPTLSWKNVTNLGNYTLHVSRSSVLFTFAKTSEARNKIYFPRFYEDRLISYSLDTNSIQCCGTEDSIDSCKGTTLPLHCGWISPKWS